MIILREHFNILPIAIGCAGCTVRQVPPSARLVDRLDVRSDDEPRVDLGEAKQHLVTRATSHFAPFELLSGIPVVGILDALTVEYGTFDRFVLQRDLERLRRYYRARGFYDAQVRAGRVEMTANGHVRVEIAVREGEPVLLESVEGPKELLPRAEASAAESEALLAAGKRIGVLVSDFEDKPLEDPPPCSDRRDPACRRKPRFDEDRYERLLATMRRSLTDSGFAYAEVRGSVEVDMVRRRARVLLVAEPGPSCRFGEIRVVGNGEIPEAAVRQRLGFSRGDSYATDKLDAAHDELADLGVFGSIDVSAVLAKDKSKRTSDVPVLVTVVPIKLRALKLGLGGLIGSQLEAHGIVGWEDRNLLGGLRTLAVELRPGLVFFPTQAPTFAPPTRVVPQAALLTAFKQPSFIERRTDLRVELAGRVYAPQITPAPDPVPAGYNIIGYYELTGSVGLDRQFRFPRIDRSSVYLGAFLRAQLDFPFSYNLDAPPPDYRRVLIPYLDVIGSWDFRKDREGKPTRVAPYRGVYTAVDAQAAFGDALDVRVQPEVRVYKPLAEHVVVAMRWTTGLLFPFNYGDSLSAERFDACNLDTPPPDCARDLQLLSFRAFYSGGPFSNRGYTFRDVGPHGRLPFATQLGQFSEFLPTGGEGMWEISGELRFLLQDTFSLVAFLDASDVVRTLRDFRLNYPHLSPGAGLRIATPVGPIRLDVGFRPPYLQKLGSGQLEPTEGGPLPGQQAPFPWAWSLAIGEAF